MEVDGFQFGLHQLEQGLWPAVVIVIADTVAIEVCEIDLHGDLIFADFAGEFLCFDRSDRQKQRDEDKEYGFFYGVEDV